MEDDDSNSNQNNLLDCLVQAQGFAFRQVHLPIIFNFCDSLYIRCQVPGIHSFIIFLI